MASGRSRSLKQATAVASICIALVLLPVATPATTSDGDLVSECIQTCQAGCEAFAAGACRGIEKRVTLLDPTCRVQVNSVCGTLCFKLCSLDSLPQPGTPLPNCFLP